MAVLHLSQDSKAESSVKVSGSDAKKVSAVLIDKTEEITKNNLNFFKGVIKNLKDHK